MAVIKNGVFTVPLYHGTTGLFIESIKRHGLGAHDPLDDFRSRELMRDLFDIAERQPFEDDRWLNFIEMIRPTVYQEKIKNGFNFTHGGSYLTPSREVAIRFANDSRQFGCEFLTFLGALYGLLGLRAVNGLDFFRDHPLIRLWEGAPWKPYVITLKNIALEDVESETGVKVDSLLEEIESLMAKGILGPHSFKLLHPVLPDQFEVARLVEGIGQSGVN
jgi:hypothetical protein